MTNKRIFGLDLMRAIAIGLVLISHFFAGIGHIGRYGVEIFFILSGYLIGGILLDELLKKKNFDFHALKIFLVRRWFRTLPNYYLFLIIHILLFIVFLKAANPLHLYKYFFFFQFFVWNRQEFFGESWSLCVEEWFYLLFSGTLFLGAKLLKDRKKIFLFVSFIFLLIPFTLRIIVQHPNLVKHYIVVYRLDSMMYGVLLSYINKFMPIFWKRLQQCFLLGAVMFFAITILESFTFRNDKSLENFFMTVTPLSIFIMLPQFSAVTSFKWRMFNNLIVNTSLWSYSLYLVHLPIIQSFKIMFPVLLSSVLGKVVFKFICFLLTVIFSRFIYLHFEKPVTSLREIRAK